MRSVTPSSQASSPWVSLDEADKSAVRFWTYVLTALDKSEPGVATASLQMLQTQHTSTLEEVLTTFINVLSQASNSYVLILDDYYLVNDPAVHASNERLSRSFPLWICEPASGLLRRAS